MTGYQKEIMRIVGCDEHTAEQIEEIMRHDIFHSTLDWQTKEEFEDGARKALAAYLVIQPDIIDWMMG